ncbi:MAG: acylneuraminate cytidylyltransferase family protein [Gemmatimonadales bacterium]|nr:acylneuraminate cytidylyltransferase family protein [Gemmatimonadales bacterium]
MIGSRRVLAVIPARGGSKGVPGKNIQPVGGRPLIGWTIAAANASVHVDRAIVTSDDEGIMAVARAEGGETPYRRDKSLATDTATSVDVILDALERVPGYDIVVLLQPTSPLRTAADIDEALGLMVREEAESCVSVCEASEHPWLMFAQDGEGRLGPYCAAPVGVSLRRQDLPPAYVLNGAIYAIDARRLEETRKFFEPGRTVAYVMPIEKSHDIDTWDDIRRVNDIL